MVIRHNAAALLEREANVSEMDGIINSRCEKTFYSQVFNTENSTHSFRFTDFRQTASMKNYLTYPQTQFYH